MPLSFSCVTSSCCGTGLGHPLAAQDLPEHITHVQVPKALGPELGGVEVGRERPQARSETQLCPLKWQLILSPLLPGHIQLLLRFQEVGTIFSILDNGRSGFPWLENHPENSMGQCYSAVVWMRVPQRSMCHSLGPQGCVIGRWWNL